MKLLRNFGFAAPDDDPERDWDPAAIYTQSGDATLMTIHVVTALRAAAEAYTALGRPEMATRCVDAAKFGYTIISGFENDLSALDM